jgi:hypothetical protein
LYAYFTNQLVLLKKQVMVLTNQNNELRSKLRKATEPQVKEPPMSEETNSADEN